MVDDRRPGEGKPAGEVERELFKYSLEDVEKQPLDRKIVTFAKARPHPAPLDRPLIRKPVKVQPAAKTPAGPEQRTLVLEVPAGSPPAPPNGVESVPEVAEPVAPAERELSREILFSRLLAFIIDIMISAVAGFLFVLVGSLAVGAAFPTTESLILSAGCALIFLILDTVFFLFSTGQTPGMAVTDLKLRAEEGGDPTLASVLLRTALFFPVAASGVGLLWSLWDPPRRCWHDRLSATRVVPSRPEPTPRAAA